jgi:quercetin dioxygenase-like cupin family protein
MTVPHNTESEKKYFFTASDFTVWPGADGSNGGLLLRWLTPGRMISMGLADLPQGLDSGFHGNEEQMVMILEGSIELTVEGGHKGVLNKGDVWYVPADVQHSARVLEGPARVLAIFVPAFTGRMT